MKPVKFNRTMKPDNLRSFNDEGRKRWAAYVKSLKADPAAGMPSDFLTDSALSKDVVPTAGLPPIPVPYIEVSDKMEFAAAIEKLTAPLVEARLSKDAWPGIWDWLAARYFDIVCPVGDSGKRKPHQVEWYVFSEAFNRQYKHRVAGPVDVIRRHGEDARLLLVSTKQSVSPSSLSQMEDEVSSRQEIFSSSAAIAVLNRMYWDPDKYRQRRGAVSNKMLPGTIRRFVAIFDQLERTFDISVIEAEALADLLPQREFGRWLKLES